MEQVQYENNGFSNSIGLITYFGMMRLEPKNKRKRKGKQQNCNGSTKYECKKKWETEKNNNKNS